jgi:hypothetical protein
MSTPLVGDRVRVVHEGHPFEGREGIVLDLGLYENEGVILADFGLGRAWVFEIYVETIPHPPVPFTVPAGYEPFLPGSAAFESMRDGQPIEFVTYGRTDEPEPRSWARCLVIPMEQDEDGVWVAEEV